MPPEGRVGAFGGLLASDLGQFERQGGVGPRAQPGRERRRLEDDSGLAASGRAHHLATARRFEPRQQAHRRRLAAARGADQGDDLARRQRQAEWPERSSPPAVVDLDRFQRRDAHFPRNCRV
jgi:hypothetical protein